MQQIG